MKPDDEIRDDVIRELRWDPQISDPEAIGVAVTDGAVALTGHTSTYAEKMAAERAARQVYGVKAVANDLKVRLSGGGIRSHGQAVRARALGQRGERGGRGSGRGTRRGGGRETTLWYRPSPPAP